MVSGCKPEISKSDNSNVFQPGKNIAVGSFKVSSKKACIFNEIKTLTYDSEVIKNLRISMQGSDVSYPVEKFQFDIPAKESVTFILLCDIQTQVTKQGKISLKGFSFKMKFPKRDVLVDLEMNFDFKVKVPASWQGFSCSTEYPDSVTATAINDYGKAFVLSSRYVDDDHQAYIIYSFDPENGWGNVGRIDFNNGNGFSYLNKIFIDNEGNGLILWEDSSNQVCSIFARRIVGNRLTENPVRIDWIYGSSYNIASSVRSVSNLSGEVCIVLEDASIKAFIAYRLSTKEDSFERHVIRTQPFSLSGYSSDPDIALSKNGKIAGSWIEDGRKICLKFNLKGNWDSLPTMVYESYENKITDYSIRFNDSSLILTWVEESHLKDRYAVYYMELSDSGEIREPEEVFVSKEKIYSPDAVRTENSKITIFCESDSNLYSSVNQDMKWQVPQQISHTNISNMSVFLSSDKLGNLLAGYITVEGNTLCLNYVFYDNELGWLKPEKIGERAGLPPFCLSVPISVSDSGYGIALWMEYPLKSISGYVLLSEKGSMGL